MTEFLFFLWIMPLSTSQEFLKICKLTGILLGNAHTLVLSCSNQKVSMYFQPVMSCDHLVTWKQEMHTNLMGINVMNNSYYIKSCFNAKIIVNEAHGRQFKCWQLAIYSKLTMILFHSTVLLDIYNSFLH